MPFITGTLVKITPFKQLVLEIDLKQHELALKWKIPTWTWTPTPVSTDADEEFEGFMENAEIKEELPPKEHAPPKQEEAPPKELVLALANTKCYVRVSLDKYDKLTLTKKFEPLLKQRVIINGSIETFTTLDRTHYFFLLERIWKPKSE